MAEGFGRCRECGSEPIWDPAWTDRKGGWHPASAVCPRCGTVVNGPSSYGHDGPPTQGDYDESLAVMRRRWNSLQRFGT